MEREDYEKNEVVTKSGKRKLIYWNNALIKDEVGQIRNYFVQESISLNESIRKKH
jgi:hypothetical protein